MSLPPKLLVSGSDSYTSLFLLGSMLPFTVKQTIKLDMCTSTLHLWHLVSKNKLFAIVYRYKVFVNKYNLRKYILMMSNFLF